MNILVDKDLKELIEVFTNYEKFKVDILTSEEICNKAIKNCEAIFLRSTTKIDKKLIANSSVKFISSLTSGEDHINFQDIENSNIYLSTGRGGNAFAVVEYFLSALSILIMGNKITPFKSKIGIIGYGNIGKKIKFILDKIKYPNFVYDPYEIEAKNSLDDVLSCEVISLHCSYSKEGKFPSHHLLDDAVLKKIKDDQYVINTSRGEVLSDAFYRAKEEQNNFIFDVWPSESSIDFTKFTKPFLATPHIAGKTIDAEKKLTRKALGDFNSFFNESIEINDPQNDINFFVDNSIDKEIKTFGIPLSLILKIYDVKRDHMSFERFFETSQKVSFQQFRTTLKRFGFSSHKILGDLNDESKSILELFGFRL